MTTGYGAAEKLPKVVLLAIESALASGRQLSWKVQENNVGMLVQLVWKSSESRNLVGSNWNKLKKKPPSRQRRDVLRFLKFNAAKAPQQGHSSILDIAEKSSDTLSQELNVPTAASTSTTTCSTFPEQQQSADDGQASLLSPTTTADNVDTKPVVLGKASSALKGEELTVAKAHVHHGSDITHSTSAEPPSLLCRPLTLPPLNLPGGLSTQAH